MLKVMAATRYATPSKEQQQFPAQSSIFPHPGPTGGTELPGAPRDIAKRWGSLVPETWLSGRRPGEMESERCRLIEAQVRHESAPAATMSQR